MNNFFFGFILGALYTTFGFFSMTEHASYFEFMSEVMQAFRIIVLKWY